MGKKCRICTTIPVSLGETQMKALSLKQPWAELILQGKKTIETRIWNTNFRGEFLIHASGNLDEEAMKAYSFKELPRRAIIGKATLTEVKEYPTKEEWLADNDKHLAGDLWDGRKRYGFILINVQRLIPKQMPGKLGFFEVK